MNVKKFIFATIGQAVITMIIAAPWHLIIFKDLYHSFGIYTRAEPIIPLGFLSMFIQAAVMAYIYPRFAQREFSYKKSITFSLLMGVFLYSVSTLANAAKIELSPMATWLGIQAAFHLIQFVAIGLVLGFVYSEKRS